LIILLEKKASPMSMDGFPLLLIPLAICNIVVFLMPGLSFSAPLVTIPLMSGVGWAVTLSDVLVALGVLMLLCEVVKGARPGAKYLTDHLLSLVVFGGAAAEFVLLPQFGTSTYFLLTLLASADFLSGIALRTRRPRVASVAASSAKASSAATASAATASAGTAAKVVPPPHQAPAEPRFDPAPAATAPSMPPAEPVVEPAPPEHIEPKVAHSEPEHVEPKVAHSEVVAQEATEETAQEPTQEPGHEPSPEIQSPGIQPGSGAHPPPDNPQR
jgi:hypothetical protein